ncbi:MAG: molybdopterin-dependent oxidoreductase [Chloroflexi bacterium]|nr:molybdopterin-dependent oxidoreductase [Chloroflexota bacterium]
MVSFGVRNHFVAPVLKAETWHLTLEGAVEQPLSRSYSELSAMPAHTLTATLACAGNRRVFLTPKEKGVQKATNHLNGIKK